MTENKNTTVIAGAGGCFRKGAQIQLEHGKTIAIEELKVGDEVLAFDEDGLLHAAKVTKVHFHPEPQPILRVSFWRGETFITPNHWVLNQYNAFVEMGSLTTHDALVDGMGHLRPITGAELISHEPVYNLTVEPHHTFIADGVRVHNGGHRETYPVIAGAGGGGGKGGGGGRAAVEDADSLQSRAMISVLDLLGEGVIGGLVSGARSIYFDDTRLENDDGTRNFAGVSWDSRNGEANQSVIAGFSDVETPYNVGIQVKTTTPHPITIDNVDTDSVRILVTIPALRSQDVTTGDIHGTSVEYKFRISINNGAYEDVYLQRSDTIYNKGYETVDDGEGGTYQREIQIPSVVNSMSPRITVEGKTNAKYQRSHIIKLPKTNGAKSWNLQMVRLTADSTTTALANDTYFDSYTEIIEAKLNYPNSALVAINIDSSLFNHVPSRSYMVDGLYIQVPSNYNASTRSYNGVWNGSLKTAVSSNPAWILYDLLTNSRYGLGQYLSASQIDKAKLYQIGKYCDELVPDGFGGFEPRFTVNTVIQTQGEAFKLISDLTSAFRGMAYWNGGMVGFTQDSPSDTGMLYTPANVIDGLFSYTGSARKDRHSVVNVTWNDPADKYKQKIEYVEDADAIAKYGIRKVETVAFGCTSRGQANRVGRWILYTERLESDMVQFKVGVDSAALLPGEIIKIHDTFRAGKRMGGRIAAATTTSATLDAPITLTATGAQLSMRLPDGTFADRIVNQGVGTHATLTWNTPLADVPMANAMWIAAEASLEPMLARVIAVAQDGSKNDTFVVTAIEHNSSKFDSIELGLKLEEAKTSIIDANLVTTPTNLSITEATYEVAPGLIGTKLLVSWFSTMPQFELRWRRTGTYASSWQTITSTSATIELDNVRKSQHEFQLVALNAFGKRSQTVLGGYIPQGKTTAPGDVLNFNVERRTTDLLVTWRAVTDIDVSGYEVRVGPSWDAADIITTKFKGTMLTHDQTEPGTFYYHIRSIDSSGLYSDNVTTYTLVIDSPAAVVQFDCIQSGNRLEFRWKANTENNIVGYEIREGTNWRTAQYIALVKATTYSIPAGSDGARTFWIKAIVAPGVYGVTPAFTTTSVVRPQNINVLVEMDRKALGFAGITHDATVVSGNLVMDEGVSRSEYMFDAILPSRFRAQNTLYTSLESVSFESTTVWGNADFTWLSSDANRRWRPSSEDQSISVQYQIATDTGLQATDVDGWRLNGNLTSVGLRTPTIATGVSYGEGRYGQGLVIKDTTTVGWDVAIPAWFSQTFWVAPTEVSDATYLTLSGAYGSLNIFYRTRDASFYLEDHLGQQNKVPCTFAAGERICLGISQEAGKRTLMVGKMDGTGLASNEKAFAPVGAFTHLSLY